LLSNLYNHFAYLDKSEIFFILEKLPHYFNLKQKVF
jgi:hypothetical protein